MLSQVQYSEDVRRVTARFEDGTEATGTLLIGADGPRSRTREILVGLENAKTAPIDYAFTMCYSKHTRDRALWLRSALYHPRTYRPLSF